MTKSIISKFALTGAASITAMAISIAAAQAQAMEFDIDAQPLSAALLEFNEQAGVIVMVSGDLVEGKSSPAVKGSMEPEDALDKILSGSGLKAADAPNGAYTITLASASLGEGATDTRPFRVASLAQEEEIQEVERRGEEEDGARQDVIVVTGTNIRGIIPESSPVQRFSKEDIQISGAATAQDFLRLVPSNFGGGAAEFGNAPGNNQAGGNSSNGVGVNLRGLGSGSTLVLVNGRRVAPSSTIGGFVDISMIPASVIERIEILGDGASSIYGADAVAGVTNIVLRDDFSGIEVSGRAGTATQGGLDEYRAGVTAGGNWSSGSALASFEYYDRSSLDSSERSFSVNALSPNDLLPSQDRFSFFGAVNQDLGNRIDLSFDALYSEREAVDTNTILQGGSFGDLVVLSSRSRNLNLGSAASWDVGEDWFIDLSGVYSRVEIDLERTTNDIQDRSSASDSNMGLVEVKGSGPLFGLPGGTVKAAIGGQFRKEDFFFSDQLGNIRDGERDVYGAFGEVLIPLFGDENARPGLRRLELNVSGRYEDYSDFGSSANPKIGVLWEPISDFRLRSTFGTSFRPPTLGQTGARDRLGLAVDTSLIFGLLGQTATDPSLEDTVILYLQGTDTDLDAEESESFTVGFDFDQQIGSSTITISSTFFDIEFENRISQTPAPNNINDLFAFNVGFVQPNLFPPNTFDFSVTESELQSVLANLSAPANSFGGADPNDATILDFVNISRNLSRTQVRGLDFNAVLSLPAWNGEAIIGVDGTYLLDFTQQAASSTPEVEQLNTQFNPVDFRVRGQVGYKQGGFSGNIFLNYTDSYATDGTDTAMPIESWTTVDLALAYAFERTSNSRIFGDGLTLRLVVQNLFDQDPPEALSLPDIGFLGYDPTNASPIGRFMSFELSKRF